MRLNLRRFLLLILLAGLYFVCDKWPGNCCVFRSLDSLLNFVSQKGCWRTVSFSSLVSVAILLEIVEHRLDDVQLSASLLISFNLDGLLQGLILFFLTEVTLISGWSGVVEVRYRLHPSKRGLALGCQTWVVQKTRLRAVLLLVFLKCIICSEREWICPCLGFLRESTLVILTRWACPKWSRTWHVLGHCGWRYSVV